MYVLFLLGECHGSRLYGQFSPSGRVSVKLIGDFDPNFDPMIRDREKFSSAYISGER